MLDKKLNLMLEAANALTADDLDCLRGTASVAAVEPPDEEPQVAASPSPELGDETFSDDRVGTDGALPPQQVSRSVQPTMRRRAAPTSSGVSAGEYERLRTRESKVSTACMGHEREKHNWWPIGTELIGRIGSETFTATVVENTQVKSNRSLLITSGPANGRVCITPTRAAMEATETYRQAHNLGRGGGVTNGWEFWKAQA